MTNELSSEIYLAQQKPDDLQKLMLTGEQNFYGELVSKEIARETWELYNAIASGNAAKVGALAKTLPLNEECYAPNGDLLGSPLSFAISCDKPTVVKAILDSGMIDIYNLNHEYEERPIFGKNLEIPNKAIKNLLLNYAKNRLNVDKKPAKDVLAEQTSETKPKDTPKISSEKKEPGFFSRLQSFFSNKNEPALSRKIPVKLPAQNVVDLNPSINGDEGVIEVVSSQKTSEKPLVPTEIPIEVTIKAEFSLNGGGLNR